jgi:hypothetical protein
VKAVSISASHGRLTAAINLLLIALGLAATPRCVASLLT